MVRCINCLVAVPATQQYHYNAIYLGPEIVLVLEEWIDRQVIDEDFLCQECVNLLIVEANNRNEGNIGKRQYGHQSVCIGCGASVARKGVKHTRVINQGDPVWSYFADAIRPLEIPSNARVCMPCWLKADQRPSFVPLSTASNEAEDAKESDPLISAPPPSSAGRHLNNDRKPSDTGNCDLGEPVVLKVCRICLAMDKKLYPIRKYKLDQAYKNLTGFMVSEQDKLPQKLCYECVQRLINCSRFRTKSLRAMTLMMQIVKNQDHLTIGNLKSLSRMNKQFISPLAPRYFAPDHYDCLLNNDAIKKNNDEFLEEIDFVIDTDYSQSESMDSSDDSGPLRVKKRKKMATKTPKRVTNKLSKEANSKIVKCKTTSSSLVHPVPNKLLPKYREIDNGVSYVEIEIDMESENNKLVKGESDVKIEDSIDVASERDCATDDSVVPEVKKRKKETKKVKKAPQRDDTKPKRNLGGKPPVTLNELLFNVTELTLKEQVAEIEKRKESSNYKNALFKCTLCYKGYLDEKAYDFHMLKHTNEFGENQCAVCKTHFKGSYALRKHITNQHSHKYSCKQCPYESAHKHSALLHERWHKGTKYSCPHCPDEFLKFSTYMGHIRLKHPSDIVCQLCGFSFVSEKGKNMHMKLKHRMENAPIPEDGPHCEPCNIRFMSTEALKRHISVSARHHSDDKAGIKYNAPKYRTKTKDNIQRATERFGKEVVVNQKPRQRRIKLETPIPCEQCGVELEGSRAYHSHFRQMHPGENRTNYPSMKAPCMCEVCGRIFPNIAQLKDHRGTHTGDIKYECDMCGQSFVMKQRLLIHIKRRHTARANKAYPCSICGKSFNSTCQRQRHVVIHSELRPFECETCGKAFKHKRMKRAHVKYVHLKKPWPKRKRDRQAPRQPPSNMPAPDMST